MLNYMTEKLVRDTGARLIKVTMIIRRGLAIRQKETILLALPHSLEAWCGLNFEILEIPPANKSEDNFWTEE